MWQRFKKWFNVDHIVDLSVDLFLILFDVLSSPILIVMRLIRWVVGNFVLDGFKNKIKQIIHWTEKKPRWVKFTVIPLLIIIAFVLLVFIWIFGQAWTEFVLDEFGNNK